MGKIIRAIDEWGVVRVTFADTTDIAEKAQSIHHTSPVATAALGRTLSMAAIMGSQLKSPDNSVTLLIKGDGPLGSVLAVADGDGMVKGYVQNPAVDIAKKANGKLDVSGAIGKGMISVSKDLGLKEPYTGQVPIVSGEIAEDFTYYFATSEQTPTAVGLGVLVDRDYSVKRSGGFMVQLMPAAMEEDIARVEENISKITSVTQMMEDGMTAEDIIAKLLDGFEFQFLDSAEYEYRCDCSMDKIKRALISLGKIELEDIINTDGRAELTCQFCPEVYTLEKADLEELLESAK
ncbi:MAG: Hsp33 family molecular chaperone HslO [Clostridia bacterium]|nr:Hsp33 family molecular chaperone HslO [Clostridia bacterium]